MKILHAIELGALGYGLLLATTYAGLKVLDIYLRRTAPDARDSEKGL